MAPEPHDPGRLGGMKRGPWYWRLLLLVGIALAIDLLLDDKLVLALIALAWIGACSFSLWRIRRNRAASAPTR
jgi:hypothetical protein